jgi:hypothetical protein
VTKSELLERVRELEVMLEVTGTRLIYCATGGRLEPDELDAQVADLRRVLMVPE